MSDRTKTTESREAARLVRLSIEASRAMNILYDELEKAGEDLSSLRYAVARGSRDIMESALQVPGMRIAVFPIEEKQGEDK